MIPSEYTRTLPEQSGGFLYLSGARISDIAVGAERNILDSITYSINYVL